MIQLSFAKGEYIMAKKSGGLPSYTRTNSVSSGTSPLKGSHSVARDGIKGGIAGRGIKGLAHSSTKPSGSSGTIGASGPLKSTSTDSDKRNTGLGRVYIRTKSQK